MQSTLIGEVVSWYAPKFAIDPNRLRSVFEKYNVPILVPTKPTEATILRRAVREFADPAHDVVYVGKDHRLCTVAVTCKVGNVQTGAFETELIESVTYDRHTGQLLFREEGNEEFMRNVVDRMRSRVRKLDDKDLARMLSTFLTKRCGGILAERGSYLIPNSGLYLVDRLEFAMKQVKMKTTFDLCRISFCSSQTTCAAISFYVARYAQRQLAMATRNVEYLTNGRNVTLSSYRPRWDFDKNILRVSRLKSKMDQISDDYGVEFQELHTQADSVIADLNHAIEICLKKREKVKAEGRVKPINQQKYVLT